MKKDEFGCFDDETLDKIAKNVEKKMGGVMAGSWDSYIDKVVNCMSVEFDECEKEYQNETLKEDKK